MRRMSTFKTAKSPLIRAMGPLPKHSIFYDATQDRMERQEKQFLDIFDHNIDRKSNIKTNKTIVMKKLKGNMEEQNLKSLDDTYIDLSVQKDFLMFEHVSESLMKLVFESALNKGFFGMLNNENTSQKIIETVKAQISNKSVECAPLNTHHHCPQQLETRKQVIERKSVSEKKVWVVDLESRIKPNKALTILIVDDSESDRLFILETVSSEFENVVIDEASDGREAFKKVESAYYVGTRYDVIFMDMNMANYDGRDGISMIRLFERRNKIAKPVTICAISADEFEDDSTLDSYGVYLRLKKPLTLDLLRMVLKRTTNTS